MDYEFRRKHGKIHIKKYTGTGGKITVPQFIEGLPVTKIESFAFADSEITEIIIPDGIRIINSCAFWGCGKLKKITFQGRIDYCYYAFHKSAIEEISGIENLAGCYAITFQDTPFYEKNETLIIGDKLVYCREKSEVIRIPEYVRTIGYCAFRHSSAKKIILPEKLRKIENLAFLNSDIIEIYVPDSVEEFGINALSCCENLKKIRFPEDFSRREKWKCYFDFSEKNHIINDTLVGVNSDSDILIYENVKNISVTHVYMTSPLRLREKQIFPEKLEHIKYPNIIADSRVNVFRNDTFKVEKSNKVFNVCMWGAVNISRRCEIIFDFEGVYAEVLLYFPFVPYGNYKTAEKSAILDFYEECLVNAPDGRFFDFAVYDGHILEQDIPFRIKAEIAVKRLKSNYRLTDEARENYRNYFRVHRKKLNLVSIDKNLLT